MDGRTQGHWQWMGSGCGGKSSADANCWLLIQGGSWMGMMGFSSTGCRSGSFTNSTRRSTPAQLSPMTVRVEQCLSVIAPRAFREAMRQAALLRVTVKLWSEAGILGDLIAQTTFLALTRKPYYAGRMRLSPSPGSPGLYLLPIAETAEIGTKRVCDIPAPLVLWDLARRKQHLEGVSIYHVWTSQEILSAEDLPLPGRSFGQSPASPSAG